MRLYLDANVIIYLVEGSNRLRNSVLSWTDQAEAQPDSLLITSALSLVECRVKPLREGQTERLAQFTGFFERDRLLVAQITRPVLDRTTELRARFGFKTPDAVHLATALEHGASVFLTSDPAFRRYPNLEVALVDPDAV